MRFQCTQPVAKACWSITTRDPIVYRADLRGITKLLIQVLARYFTLAFASVKYLSQRPHPRAKTWHKISMTGVNPTINKKIFYQYRNFDHLHKMDGLIQERRNSIANTLELHLSCTNPSKWSYCHLIFIMAIPVPGQMVFILKQTPGLSWEFLLENSCHQDCSVCVTWLHIYCHLPSLYMKVSLPKW